MKKILVVLLCVSVLSQCAILDPLGLTTDRLKGSEAASQIKSAAITQDLLISVAFTGRASVSIFSFLADTIAGIDSSKYYLKSDVNDCISKIKGFEGFLVGTLITIAASCKLNPADGYITGKPLPKL